MLEGIADTHTAIWYFASDKRLSVAAKAFWDGVRAKHNQLGISAITLAEIVYLIEKGRVGKEALRRLQSALDKPNTTLVLIPFDRAIAETLPRVERAKVPDLPDRIIAATALHMGVPLISKDAKIRAANLTTIW